jgi:copper(I)-binding protein
MTRKLEMGGVAGPDGVPSFAGHQHMKVGLSIFALATILAIGISSPGSAHQVVVGKLKIGHPWVREAADGAPGTYSCIIEIQNDGDEPERLLGATIEGAGTGVLYKLTENNGHFTSRPFEEGLVIKSDRVDITLSRGRVTELLAGSMDLTMQQASANATDSGALIMASV